MGGLVPACRRRRRGVCRRSGGGGGGGRRRCAACSQGRVFLAAERRGRKGRMRKRPRRARGGRRRRGRGARAAPAPAGAAPAGEQRLIRLLCRLVLPHRPLCFGVEEGVLVLRGQRVGVEVGGAVGDFIFLVVQVAGGKGGGRGAGAAAAASESAAAASAPSAPAAAALSAAAAAPPERALLDSVQSRELLLFLEERRPLPGPGRGAALGASEVAVRGSERRASGPASGERRGGRTRRRGRGVEERRGLCLRAFPVPRRF